MLGGFLQRITLNMRHRGGIFLYAKLHFRMELEGPQHLHEFDLPHVVQFPRLILQLHGLHKDEKKSHVYAYVNPLLI
jgi:hypothetical protein